MDIEIQKQEGSMVALTINARPDDLEKAVAQVYRAYAKRLNIPGFRKGKVPRQILERYVAREEAEEEAIEHLANQGYRQAVDEHGLTPMGRATLEQSSKGEDGSVVITATVAVRPEVTLGPYKGLKATKQVAEVTDEHVASELEKLRARHAEFRAVEDRGVEQGDLAIVDCTLLVDGQPHEEGSATGYPLEVGSDTLFPELNESLPGAEMGEERRVPVTYPAGFHRPELAGKSGEFVVTVREVKERVVPDLTDDFVRAHTSASGVEELRGAVRRTLEAVAEAMAESNVRADLAGQVVEASQADAPADLVEREAERRAEAVEAELAERDEDLDAYLARRGLSERAWRRSLEVEARGDVRRALVLDAIGRAEGLDPSEEEIEGEVARLAEEEGRTREQTRRRLERDGDLDRVVNRVYHRKIIDLLVEHADITTETVAAPAPEAAEGAEGQGHPEDAPPGSAEQGGAPETASDVHG